MNGLDSSHAAALDTARHQGAGPARVLACSAAAAVVGPKTAEQVAEALGTTLEAASAWLVEGLRAAGVLREAGGQRTYWLPGVGTFALYLDRPGQPPMIG